jgi:hypothetical protein
MKHASSFFAGLCLLLSACGGLGDAPDLPATAGAAGSGEAVNSAGSPSFGGSSGDIAGASNSAGSGELGGASNIAGAGELGGASNVAGAGELGGASDLGGASAAGGQDGTSTMGEGGSKGSSHPSIDYSIWQLQLPTGSGNSPKTVAPKQLLAGYSDTYFYEGADGGQVFMDPATGITTSGSQHCRTEMRESASSGGETTWAASKTNTMTVTGMVTKLGDGSSGNVTVGQVFNGSDSITLGELQYSGSRKGFVMFYEEAKSEGGSTDLKTPVALNTKYTFELALSKGVLTVHINGTQVYSHTPSSSTLAKKFYFKFGNYDQHATGGSVSKTPFTVVEAYSVEVVHK